MAQSVYTNLRGLTYLQELLFSVYVPFLVVATHETGSHWAIDIVLWGISRGHLHPTTAIEDYRVDEVDFLLIWISVISIFLLLQILRRFASTRMFLRNFAIIPAAFGLPLANLYERPYGRFLFVGVLIIGASGFAIFLWCIHKWPVVSKSLNIFLLTSYFALWSLVGQGGRSWLIFWPSWHWASTVWPYIWLIYPVIGFCSALVWTAYFRATEEPHLESMPPVNAPAASRM